MDLVKVQELRPTTRLQKVRFYSSVLGINLALLLFLVYLISPQTFFKPQPSVSFNAVSAARNQAASIPEKPVIAGKPVRLLLPGLGLDLPVTEGIYNSADGTWSLSDRGAHFALPSYPANDHEGNTIIYGHNNKYVFGRLTALAPGQTVQLLTDNGRTFTYVYESVENVKPNNITAFHYEGPPILTIQTCSGNWNEWRSMYRFKLLNVA